MSGFFNEETKATYNFVAPKINKDSWDVTEVPFPTQEVAEVTLSSNVGTYTVERSTTILKLGTLAAASTLVLTAGGSLKAGDLVVVAWTEPSTAAGCELKHGETTLQSSSATKGGDGATVVKQLIWEGSTWLVL